MRAVEAWRPIERDRDIPSFNQRRFARIKREESPGGTPHHSNTESENLKKLIVPVLVLLSAAPQADIVTGWSVLR